MPQIKMAAHPISKLNADPFTKKDCSLISTETFEIAKVNYHIPLTSTWPLVNEDLEHIRMQNFANSAPPNPSRF